MASPLLDLATLSEWIRRAKRRPTN
jgi:hypothetical protein